MRFFLSCNRNDGCLLPVVARDRYTIRVLYRFHAKRGRDIQPLLHRADHIRRCDVLYAGNPFVLLDQR